MEEYELYYQLDKLKNDLTNEISQLEKAGKELANKNVNYRIIKSKEIMELQAKDESVSLIKDLVYQNKDVALAKLEYEKADVMYKVSQEKINMIKYNIKIVENQISREYQNVRG